MRYLLLLCCWLPIFTSAQNIEWDKSTLRKVVPVANDQSANYARIIQLPSGQLLCVYETVGNVACVFSNDLGNSWSAETTVAKKEVGLNMTVPEVIELQDKSLLASYNPRPYLIDGKADTSKHFEIRTKKSYDCGKTWRDERMLYQASDKFENGCWEPAQLQLKSGKILLFFSNENIYRDSDEQNISVLTSADGGLNWSKDPKIVSFKPHFRDGMPVPIVLKGKNSILFSIEDNANGNFKPTLVELELNNKKFGGIAQSSRYQPFVNPLPDTVYAGAPYLQQLHSGRTILSFQSTQNRTNNWQHATMQVAIGNKLGQNFVLVNEPFQVPKNKHALWNSICILSDDTILAIASTDAYDKVSTIWMIKGKLIDKK
ncbi:MAG: exo-alpha-sialidase [Pedobacter sp.]|nr:exo-alpha-sialidase [Pedobacter sp.]